MTKINVTQSHIDKGERGNACGCPVALALSEAFPKARIGVILKYFNVSNGKIWHTIFLPLDVVKFIRDFDSEEKVEPISFDVDEEEIDSILAR